MTRTVLSVAAAVLAAALAHADTQHHTHRYTPVIVCILLAQAVNLAVLVVQRRRRGAR